MQAQYRTEESVRPLRLGCVSSDQTGRLFLCARCRAQVLICSHCDRGHRYCAEGCSWQARRQSQREAGRRYERTRDGRFARAERNRRYRKRIKIETHQGSPRHRSDGVVVMTSTVVVRQSPALGANRRCHWCGRLCPDAVRLEPRRRRVHRNNRRGPERDHSP